MNTAEELKLLQSLPLEVKIRKTQERIREWVDVYGTDGCYVSRSGGKDSDVLGDIVRKMYPEIPHVFINTGLEFDSVRLHAVNECDTVLRPEMGFVEVIKKYGYPIISKEVANTLRLAKPGNTRMKKLNGELINENGDRSMYNCNYWHFLLNAPFKISEQCCDVMKKRPFYKYSLQVNKKPFLGLMAEESVKRRNAWIKTGCNAFEKSNPQSQPLAFWTEQDILQYILENNIKIADVYGNIIYEDSDGFQYENPLFDSSMKLTTTGATRTGCVFCMFGITQDKERFLKLKEVEPKKYDYVMRGGDSTNKVCGSPIRVWAINL